MKDYKELVKCPKCKRNTLVRNLQADLPNGSVVKGESELTVGELARRNSERFSEDYKEHLHNKNNAYRDNPPKFKEPKAVRKAREMKEFLSGLSRSDPSTRGKKNGKKK
jgi:hypothetical protein